LSTAGHNGPSSAAVGGGMFGYNTHRQGEAAAIACSHTGYMPV